MIFKKALKWFTLVELLISLVILGILSVVLFKAYVNLMNISTRIYNEKQLVQSVDFVFFKVDTLLNAGWVPVKATNWLGFVSGDTFLYLKQEGSRLLLSGGKNLYELTSTGEVRINDLNIFYVTWNDDKLLGFGLNIDAQIERYSSGSWVFDVQGVFQRYFDTSFRSLIK